MLTHLNTKLTIKIVNRIYIIYSLLDALIYICGRNGLAHIFPQDKILPLLFRIWGRRLGSFQNENEILRFIVYCADFFKLHNCNFINADVYFFVVTVIIFGHHKISFFPQRLMAFTLCLTLWGQGVLVCLVSSQ